MSEIMEHLESMGISQPKMAYAIGCTKDWVNRVLNGRVICSSRMKTKMSVFINAELQKK